MQEKRVSLRGDGLREAKHMVVGSAHIFEVVCDFSFGVRRLVGIEHVYELFAASLYFTIK